MFNFAQQPLMTGHWCRSIATMLVSGMSVQQVFATIKAQDEHNHALVDACNKALVDVNQGLSFTAVAARYRFFDGYHVEQLKIAELAGKLPLTLMNIAHRLERKNERNQKLRAQLRFSQAVIVLGVLANILLAIVKEVSFIREIMALLIVTISTKLIFRVIDSDIFYLLAKAWNHHILQSVGVLKRLFEYYWYLLLALQLEAGIDPAQAVANLRDLLPSSVIRNNVRKCQRHLEQGKTLVLALSQAHLILTSEFKQMLLIGEKSGRLVSSLRHHLELEQQYLDLKATEFYEWLPRLYYVVAISLMMRFVL